MTISRIHRFLGHPWFDVQKIGITEITGMRKFCATQKKGQTALKAISDSEKKGTVWKKGGEKHTIQQEPKETPFDSESSFEINEQGRVGAQQNRQVLDRILTEGNVAQTSLMCTLISTWVRKCSKDSCCWKQKECLMFPSHPTHSCLPSVRFVVYKVLATKKQRQFKRLGWYSSAESVARRPYVLPYAAILQICLKWQCFRI